MSQIFRDLQLSLQTDLEAHLRTLFPDLSSFRILRESVDARRSNREPIRVFTVECFGPGESLEPQEIPLRQVRLPHGAHPPVVIGMGPAGLFAALRFVERGLPCVLLERGSPAESRIRSINRFWRYGELNPEDNVCFGEGGAGLYSDGKLITRIHSPHQTYVLDRLVRFGAPEEIRWVANPHVGSDRIRRLIPKLRAFLIEKGAVLHFNCAVQDFDFDRSGDRPRLKAVHTSTGLRIPADQAILATGHSAEDIFDILKNHHIFMEGKSFAVGLRVEHPQELINRIQYRSAWNHPVLGAANYRLTDHQNSSGAYSFCMCPGGYVLSSTTSKSAAVSNGMSNYNRSSPRANAAIVVTINHQEMFSDTLDGLRYRQQIEQAGQSIVDRSVLKGVGKTSSLPAQNLLSFLDGKDRPINGTSCISGVVDSPLHAQLPDRLVQRLREAFDRFQGKMRGFLSEDATVIGMETRTSCPVRVTRDSATLVSVSHDGLYPTGEGAGYAGGITSAACDGVRVADQVMSSFDSRS